MTRPPRTPRTLRPTRMLALLAIALVALLVTVRLTGVAERLAYFPSNATFLTPPQYQDVSFTTEDGLTLHAWFMPAPGATPDNPGPAVLHCHGNAGTLADHEPFSAFLARRGISVLLFDYRSYGRSDTGSLNRNALLKDTRAAFEALRARPEVDPERVGALGVSLGGAFAAALAAENKEVRSLALVSTFSTWQGVAHDALPGLGPLLMPPGLEQQSAVTQLAPRHLLLLHGDADRIIHPRHAQRLADAAQSANVPHELVIIKDGDHNALLPASQTAQDTLTNFFTRTLSQHQPPEQSDTPVSPTGGEGVRDADG
ncbi:MAG: alpha/beta hydrolase [Phycisphaerales bacterium JB040]